MACGVLFDHFAAGFAGDGLHHRYSRAEASRLAHANLAARRDSDHARVPLQNLLQVLRKRRPRHHDVGAGFLRLLL